MEGVRSLGSRSMVGVVYVALGIAGLGSAGYGFLGV